MAKNIVVMSDGTGQEGGTGNDTNVYKLFNMIEDRTERQITFYDRGLGTGWRKLTGTACGMGITKNILECYQFIFEHYSAGDQLYLFGFSRGATTVRSLSGFIHLFGILPKSRPELIKRAYKIYKMRDQAKRLELAAALVKQHHNHWCSIKFLGVWDTVAALGIPIKWLDVIIDQIPLFHHEFHNLRLSESVQNACQALAIDEERLTFHPMLWDEKLLECQTMKQVWFCGMHTDVGGGYQEQELSDIPLVWLVAEAKEHGLLIYPQHQVVRNPDIDGMMHDSRGGKLAKLYRRRVRSWDSEQRGKPTVHESVVIRKPNRGNTHSPRYSSWILNMEYNVEPWPEPHRTVDHLL